MPTALVVVEMLVLWEGAASQAQGNEVKGCDGNESNPANESEEHHQEDCYEWWWIRTRDTNQFLGTFTRQLETGKASNQAIDDGWTGHGSGCIGGPAGLGLLGGDPHHCYRCRVVLSACPSCDSLSSISNCSSTSQISWPWIVRW
jgi:hypothetical protein